MFQFDKETDKLDKYSLSNICESRDDEFSPFQTSIKMRKNKHLASQKHSNISEEMQLKDLCRVSENFGYLNKKLPVNFVRDFLCQFYQIFKKKST